MKFTYTAYAEMVDKLKKNGYSFADYKDCDNYEKCVIIRHDIDTDCQKALKLARLEKDLGIKSTYFALLTSEMYNLAAKVNLDAIEEICNLGHNVGLHFDEVRYIGESEVEKLKMGGSFSVEQWILNEVEIMERLLNREVNCVSMHRPSKTTLEADYDLGRVVNSYGMKFFKGYKYVSDSRRRWREDVLGIIDSGEYDKLHILTHAFWYNDEEESIEETVGKYVKSGNADRWDSLEKNITDLSTIIGRNEI